MKYLLFLVCLIYFSCGSKQNDKVPQGRQLSLFIIPEYKNSFRLDLDGKMHFDTYQVDNGKHGPQELITKFEKPKDSIQVRLQIANWDTLFVQNIKKADSLISGLD